MVRTLPILAYAPKRRASLRSAVSPNSARGRLGKGRVAIIHLLTAQDVQMKMVNGLAGVITDIRHHAKTALADARIARHLPHSAHDSQHVRIAHIISDVVIVALQNKLDAAEQQVQVLMGQLAQAPEDDVQDSTLSKA